MSVTDNKASLVTLIIVVNYTDRFLGSEYDTYVD